MASKQREIRRAAERAADERAQRALSGRQFLAETTLAGAVLTLPAWVAGCGSDDNDGSRSDLTNIIDSHLSLLAFSDVE